MRKRIKEFITKAYSGAKNKWVKQDALSLPDKKAISVLSRHNCFWLGEHYGKHISPKIAELTQEALDEGIGCDALAERLKKTLGGEDYKYWDVAASVALVRARSFGAISGMEEAGIIEYEILAMGDERTCDICGAMNGKVFSVAETRKVIDRVLDITDSEAFKEAMPWQTKPPVGKTSSQLTADGQSLPPFHGRCRCTLVMVDSFLYDLSGALNDKNDPDRKRRDAHAERYYETMRRSNPDIIANKLSKNGGISIKSAQKVYRHVFINKYNLYDGLQCFDPSYDMAQSIQRLLSGNDIQEHDLVLLKHERLEYELMNRYNKNCDTAHNLTDKKHDYKKALDKWKGERVNRYYPDGKEKWGIVSINRKTGDVFHDKPYDENDHTGMYHGMAWSRLRKYQAVDNYPKKSQIAWY